MVRARAVIWGYREPVPSLCPGSVRLDSQGRQYEADTDTFGYIPVEKDIFLNQVNPGVIQEGRIIYSVAPDAAGFTVHAGDLSLFGSEEAKISLGF